MIPEYVLSSEVVKGTIVGAKRGTTVADVDYEDGGIALNDPSEGFFYQVWTCTIDEGRDIVVSAPSVADTIVYTGSRISEVSLTFDQNMRVAVAFIEDGLMKLLWYDTTIAAEVVTTFTGKNPRVLLDDKRDYFLADSDILLFYVKNRQLYMRAQRDRFMIEYMLHFPIDGRLRTVGMGRHYRVQIVGI